MNLILCSLLFFGFGISNLAWSESSDHTGTGHFVVRAERSTPHGHEQIALVINTDEKIKKAKLVLNANFLGKPKSDVRLGEFYSHQMADIQPIIAELKQTSLRIPKDESEPSQSLHSVRLFLGKNELDPDSDYGASLLVLLERAQLLESWEPHQAIDIHRTPSGSIVSETLNEKIEKSTHPRAVLKCKDDSEETVCTDSSWGTAYLSLK